MSVEDPYRNQDDLFLDNNKNNQNKTLRPVHTHTNTKSRITMIVIRTNDQ